MKNKLKKIIKNLSKKLPGLKQVALFYRKHRKSVSQNKQLGKESRREVFSSIYTNKVWGG